MCRSARIGETSEVDGGQGEQKMHKVDSRERMRLCRWPLSENADIVKRRKHRARGKSSQEHEGMGFCVERRGDVIEEA